MRAKSRIVLTSPSGLSHTIRAFDSVKISESEGDPVKTATVEALFIDNQHILEHHTINSTLEVFANAGDEPEELFFHGFLSSVPKVLEGNVKKYSFEAQDVLGKTKNILINETFENMEASEIVNYLLRSYTDFFESFVLDIPQMIVTLQFRDEYLYDCLMKISEITSTIFEVNREIFQMKPSSEILNPNTIKRNMFERGTGKFTDDSSQMVNHLRLYGAKELTPYPRTEEYHPNGSTTSFYTTYQPSNVKVYRDGALMRLGVMYLNDNNDQWDVYLDYNNSLLEFVNPPKRGELVEIVYQYYQRIVMEETDQNSIEKYGYYMKTENVEHIADRNTLRQLAREKIRINNKPKKVGSLTIFKNQWRAREKVLVDIPELGVNDILGITNKGITITPNWLTIDLSFQEKPDLSTILKNHLNRIRELEKKKEELIVVDKYRTIEEKIELSEFITVEIIPREYTFKIGITPIGNGL